MSVAQAQQNKFTSATSILHLKREAAKSISAGLKAYMQKSLRNS